MTRAEKKAAKAAAAAEALLTQNLEISTETSPEEIEDVVLSLEVIEDVSEMPAAEQPKNFDEVLAAVTDEQIEAKLVATVTAIDERADFERVKDADNAKIQKTIAGARKALITKRAARLMVATNLDPSTFNRVIHEGARYNVYALGKLADVINGAVNKDDGTKGAITNAINVACMKSLFQFRAAGMQFNGEMAKCAASDKIRIERAVSDHLRRHTVSASTAPTQASSTMQALETLGVVKRSGSGKNPNFDLTDNPIVEKVRAVLAA